MFWNCVFSNRNVPVTSSLLCNSSTQWRAVVMTGKFLKTLELLQLEYKSWDSPTAETERHTEEKRHFNSVWSDNKRTQHWTHSQDDVLSWTPVCPQTIHGLLLARPQSVSTGQSSVQPAGSTAQKPRGAPQQSGADGQTLNCADHSCWCSFVTSDSY